MDRLEQVHRAAQMLGHAIEPGLDVEHLDRGEERVEHDFLRHDADGRLGVAAVGVDVVAPDLDRARGLEHEARQRVDQGRLARAIGAEQAEDLPARHVEAHPLQRALGRRLAGGGIFLGQIADADGRFVGDDRGVVRGGGGQHGGFLPVDGREVKASDRSKLHLPG
jgi:hypothetical protein